MTCSNLGSDLLREMGRPDGSDPRLTADRLQRGVKQHGCSWAY